MARKKETTGPLEIQAIGMTSLRVYIVGITPLVLHRMSEKAKRELLMPKGKKTTAEKAANLKHDPLQEYRDSAYRMEREDAPTALAFPSSGVKKAIAAAALVVGGAKKAEIGRLTWVPNRYLPVYGVPSLYMDIVRMSDISRTPDIRTRAALPAWAMPVEISYVPGQITAAAIGNLLHAAGLTIGIGDGRQEKGALNYGQFRLADENDEELRAIIASGGREAQLAALEDPAFFDGQSEELYQWYASELRRRGLSAA